MIIDEVEHAYESTSDSAMEDDLRNETLDHGYAEVSQLRHNLLPLTVIESSLSSELNGGISVTRQGTYVRPGWQSLARDQTPDDTDDSIAGTSAVYLAASTLASTYVDIELLWRHSFVKALLNLGRLRLEESAPL